MKGSLLFLNFWTTSLAKALITGSRGGMKDDSFAVRSQVRPGVVVPVGLRCRNGAGQGEQRHNEQNCCFHGIVPAVLCECIPRPKIIQAE